MGAQMRIKITAGGIFGLGGEIAVGTELTVATAPDGWAGRYEVINAAPEKAVAVTNPKRG